MAKCRACGGVLGRDCYNEEDCLRISQNTQSYYEQDIQYLENYLSVLIYTLEQNKIPVPPPFTNCQELVLKPQLRVPFKDEFDELPF